MPTFMCLHFESEKNGKKKTLLTVVRYRQNDKTIQNTMEDKTTTGKLIMRDNCGEENIFSQI